MWTAPRRSVWTNRCICLAGGSHEPVVHSCGLRLGTPHARPVPALLGTNTGIDYSAPGRDTTWVPPGSTPRERAEAVATCRVVVLITVAKRPVACPYSGGMSIPACFAICAPWSARIRSTYSLFFFFSKLSSCIPEHVGSVDGRGCAALQRLAAYTGASASAWRTLC